MAASDYYLTHFKEIAGLQTTDGVLIPISSAGLLNGDRIKTLNDVFKKAITAYDRDVVAMEKFIKNEMYWTTCKLVSLLASIERYLRAYIAYISKPYALNVNGLAISVKKAGGSKRTLECYNPLTEEECDIIYNELSDTYISTFSLDDIYNLPIYIDLSDYRKTTFNGILTSCIELAKYIKSKLGNKLSIKTEADAIKLFISSYTVIQNRPFCISPQKYAEVEIFMKKAKLELID